MGYPLLYTPSPSPRSTLSLSKNPRRCCGAAIAKRIFPVVAGAVLDVRATLPYENRSNSRKKHLHYEGNRTTISGAC